MLQSKILTIFVVTVAILLVTIPRSSALWHRPHYQVHILNELTNNKVLLVHCNCSDHDLGDNHIKVGTEYAWTFKEHAFRTTRWRCYLAPDNNRHAYFVAYEEAFDLNTRMFDFNVYWAVKDDGVYFRDPKSHKDVFSFAWQTGQPHS
ncbi:S-protein homolog 1 [Linum perenne]